MIDDMVKSVAQIFSGNSGPGGTDLEALQGWLLKFGEDRKNFAPALQFLLIGWTIRACPGNPTLHLCLDA